MAVCLTQHAITNQKVSSANPENTNTCGAALQQNGSSIITRRWKTKLPGLSKENLANLEGATSQGFPAQAAACQRFSFPLNQRRTSFVIFFHYSWCFIMWWFLVFFSQSRQCFYLICWMWSLGARECWKSVPIFTLSETNHNALFDAQVIQKAGSIPASLTLLISIHPCFHQSLPSWSCQRLMLRDYFNL